MAVTFNHKIAPTLPLMKQITWTFFTVTLYSPEQCIEMLQYPPTMFRMSFVLLLTILFFSKVQCEKLAYLHLPEYLDTLKLLKGFTDYNTTSLCGQHVKELIRDLNSEKGWALLMFDSSAKVPSGFLTGNTLNLGQFDECLEAHHPHGDFIGKHCLLKMSAYHKINESALDLLELVPLSEISDYSEYLVTPDYVRFGFCVPSTCTADDVEDGFNSMFNNSELDQILSVSVKESECHTKESIKIKDLNWIALGPLLFFISLSILSTIYDVTHQKFLKGAKPDAIFLAFSWYSNGKNLFQITENSEQLKPLHGIRVLSTFWIVLHHAFWESSYMINRFVAIKTYNDVQHIPLYYGFVAVDTFFVLSGMLTCIVFFRDIRKKGYYDVPLGYIHRYIRLTPSYAALIFISAYLFDYLGSGPLWYFFSHEQIENCKKYWWSGLSYIQNFVNDDELCLGHTWYLSADMQLHWLSPLILYPVFFWPGFASLIFGMILLLAISTNFAVGYYYDLGPNGIFSSNPNQFRMDYLPFYTRAAPYIIGLGTGYIINKIRNEKTSIKLNKLQVLIGWLLSTGLCLATMYGSIPFAKLAPHSTLENVLYLSLYRASWGFGISWIVFACLNGYGGPINKLLSWNLFQPFSKLSYSVYLVHCSLMIYKINTKRTIPFGGDFELVLDFFAYLALSHLLAIPLTLIFEMPFANMDKYFLQNVKILPIPRQPEEEAEEKNTYLSKSEETLKEYTDKKPVEIVSTP